MITKKSKRFMAVLFTTIMTISSAASAFAAEANSAVAMLSNYNTPYTTTVTADPDDPLKATLKVTGLDAAYNRVPLSQQQAEDVTWSIKDGGTIAPSSITSKVEDAKADGFVSVATVEIPAGEDYGYAIAEAKLGTLPAFDYIIAVNPTSAAEVTAVKNISVNFKVGNTAVASKSVAELGANTDTSATAVTYPTALSAVLALQNDAANKITDVKVSGGYLTSLKIDGTSYPTSNGYWTYTVTNKDGVTYTQSEIVGAGAFQLHDGDVVTWTCTQ